MDCALELPLHTRMDRRSPGQPSCHGMFSDLQRIAENYGECLMTDHQCREEIGGFEQNSMNGMLLHGLAGNQSLIPESMANYNRGRYFIRRAANPAEETRTWRNCPADRFIL